jgi:hypothetical protein
VHIPVQDQKSSIRSGIDDRKRDVTPPQGTYSTCTCRRTVLYFRHDQRPQELERCPYMNMNVGNAVKNLSACGTSAIPTKLSHVQRAAHRNPSGLYRFLPAAPVRVQPAGRHPPAAAEPYRWRQGLSPGKRQCAVKGFGGVEGLIVNGRSKIPRRLLPDCKLNPLQFLSAGHAGCAIACAAATGKMSAPVAARQWDCGRIPDP